MNIYESIDKLISYGVLTNLIEEEDRIYARNRVLTILGMDSYVATGEECKSVSEIDEIDSAYDFKSIG